MKKLLLPILSLGIMLASCGTDVKDTTKTISYVASNLITPLDGSPAYATNCVYSFHFNLTQGTASVATDNLIINNSAQTLTTDTVSITNRIYNSGEVIGINGAKGYLNNRATPVTDLNMVISSLFYYDQTNAPGITGIPLAYVTPKVIGKYRIGNEYEVRTFSHDEFFAGKTVTTYPGAEGMETFETEGMLYRVVINVKDNTADVVIYNAKFAPKAPELTGVILTGLKVAWGAAGYEISGTNLVPSIIEGYAATPNETYKFDSFSFSTTSDNLVSAKIDYSVAGRFQGAFTGAYMVITPEIQ